MIVVESLEQVYEIINGIKNNINFTVLELEKVFQDNPIEALARLKFDRVALDPLHGGKINFIEMLNQAYSDLIVLWATEDLLVQYPGKSFELNMGALNGFDISSTDNEVIAECFAVVSVLNNQKMKKDSEKLMGQPKGIKKYIYFYSWEDKDSVIKKITEKYPEIKYKRIKQF